MVLFEMQHTLRLFHVSKVLHFDRRLQRTNECWPRVEGFEWRKTWIVDKRSVTNLIVISIFLWSQYIFKSVYLILLQSVLLSLAPCPTIVVGGSIIFLSDISTYCATFCLNLLFPTSFSCNILRLPNKKFSYLATVQANNTSKVIY
jgi:hypothetical protein